MNVLFARAELPDNGEIVTRAGQPLRCALPSSELHCGGILDHRLQVTSSSFGCSVVPLPSSGLHCGSPDISLASATCGVVRLPTSGLHSRHPAFTQRLASEAPGCAYALGDSFAVRVDKYGVDQCEHQRPLIVRIHVVPGPGSQLQQSAATTGLLPAGTQP